MSKEPGRISALLDAVDAGIVKPVELGAERVPRTGRTGSLQRRLSQHAIARA